MSDAELPVQGEVSDMPETDVETAADTEELVIISGGIVDPDQVEEPVVPDEPEAADDDESAAEFTLDELVAEMAGVSAVAAKPVAEEAAPEPEHIDPLAVAMSDAFAGAKPVEEEMWTRAPFWGAGSAWLVFVGVLTFLLWPKGVGGLESAPLYGVLIWGGAALVVLGIGVGLFIWAKAKALAEYSERAIVSRAILLRMLSWTAGGVALWIVAMIVLSLHHLDVF